MAMFLTRHSAYYIEHCNFDNDQRHCYVYVRACLHIKFGNIIISYLCMPACIYTLIGRVGILLYKDDV